MAFLSLLSETLFLVEHGITSETSTNMPCYKIKYFRKDMKEPCKAIKFAHDPQTALKLLCTGTEKKGFRLTRSGVVVEVLEVKEL